MAKELTIKINIEGKDVVLTSKQLELFKKNADELRKSLDELGERTDQNAEQFDKLKGDLESLDKIFSKTKDEVKDTGDEFEKADDKAKSLRTQIRELTQQLQVLGPRTADNAEQFDSLTTKLIELQEIQEDVGIQTQKLEDSLSQLPGPIGQASSLFKTFDNGLKNARASMVGFTKTFPILKSAIAATGIGALVILIGALIAAVVKAFNTFKPLQDAVGRLGVLFDVLEKAIQPLIDLIGRGLTVVLDGLARALAFVTGQTKEFNQALADRQALDDFNRRLEEQQFQLEILGDTYDEFERRRIEARIQANERLKELNEDEVLDEQEKARRKLLIEQRYQRDLINIDKDSTKKRSDEAKKLADERIQIEKEYNGKVNELIVENQILRATTDAQLKFEQLQRDRENQEKEIRETVLNANRRNRLLELLEENHQLKLRQLAKDIAKEQNQFTDEMMLLREEIISDYLNRETNRRALEYRIQKKQLEDQYKEIIDATIFFEGENSEKVITLTNERNQTLLLLEQRYKRDIDRIEEQSRLNSIKNEIEFFNQSIRNLERYRISVEGELLEIVSAYDSTTKFADVFLGKLSKRMSDEMMMEFDRLQDLRVIYEEQYNIVLDAINAEKELLDQARMDDLISEQTYYSEIERLEQEAVENKARYVQQKIALDRLEVESRRVSADESLRIAENLSGLLSAVAGKSKALQIASALTEAAVAIARIITDTQRAIIAFTASVAPLGPAGVPIAAAYATKAKISAGLGIATITVGAISKLKGLQGQGGESESSGRQSNNLGRGYKDGGLVLGPGTSRSDSIPANLSNGEFVMNGASTAMFLPMLEMLNNAGRSTSVPSLMTTLPDSPQTDTKSEMIVKTYVVESDITSSQHKQARLKNLSTL